MMLRIVLLLALMVVSNADPSRPCETLFYAPFDVDMLDMSQMKSSVTVEGQGSVEVKDVAGCVGGGALNLTGTPLKVWALSNNDLSDVFQIRFRFSSDTSQDNVNNFTTLFSNGCVGNNPSVLIEHRAISRSYRVSFRDETSGETYNCMTNTETPWGFHDISLEYSNGRLVLKADGEVCIESLKFSGRPALTMCPVSLGGNSLDREKNFWGFFDEVVIRRWCVVEA